MSLLLPLLLAASVPPEVAATIHDPEVTLPKLVAPLAWLGRAEPMLRPERFARWAKNNLGVADPFDPAKLKAVGIDVKKPIHQIRPHQDGPFIIEASVADAKRVDAAIAALKRGEKIVVKKALWSTAALVRPTASAPLLVARIDRRVVIQELAFGRLEPEQIAAQFAAAETLRRPRAKRGPITLQIRNVSPVARMDLAIDLASDRIEVEASVRLDLAARLVASDLISGTRAARYLEKLPSRAAEVASVAGPGAIRQALIEAGLSTTEAARARRLFAGEHAVALTEAGTLVGVARLSGSASKKEVEAFTASMKSLHSALQLRRAGPFLIGWFGGKDAKNVTSVLDEPSRTRMEEGALGVWLDPKSLFRALRARARLTGPRIGLGRLTLVEALYGPLLKATDRATLIASRKRGRIAVKMTLGF